MLVAIWSLWFNHSLSTQEFAVLYGAVKKLLKWGGSLEKWSKRGNTLNRVVTFDSSETLGAIRECWIQWVSHLGLI